MLELLPAYAEQAKCPECAPFLNAQPPSDFEGSASSHATPSIVVLSIIPHIQQVRWKAVAGALLTILPIGLPARAKSPLSASGEWPAIPRNDHLKLSRRPAPPF
jgi:hypothetical protein